MKVFAFPRSSNLGRRGQRGVSLVGLVFWLVVLGGLFLVGLKVFPTVMEFSAIQNTVNKIAQGGGSTVPEIRDAFERQRAIESNIESITGKDLDITKENDKIIVRFAYEKEIELMDPVYLTIKYHGESK